MAIKRTGWIDGKYIEPAFDRKIIKMALEEGVEYTSIMLEISAEAVEFILKHHKVWTKVHKVWTKNKQRMA